MHVGRTSLVGLGTLNGTRLFLVLLLAQALSGQQAQATELPRYCAPPPLSYVAVAASSTVQTIQQAVNANPPGSKFLLGPGLYSQQQVTPKSGDEFYGSADANCRRVSVMSGAAQLTNFAAAGGLYIASLPIAPGQQNGFCESGSPACASAEDLFIDNRLLLHVTKLADVVPGKWFFDYAAGNVYIADSPSGHTVEVSVARRAFAADASVANVKIIGLVVEKYAIPAQMGAIGDQGLYGSGWTVQDNEIRYNHGAGVSFGSGWQVIHNYIHHNGQEGFASSGATAALLDSNEIAFNNADHFLRGWEAGGGKFTNSVGMTLSNNCVHDNFGIGLWSDVGSLSTTYSGNVVTQNENEGIFHEISYDAQVTGNIAGYNGIYNGFNWAWGAQIELSSSKNTTVSGNYVETGATYGSSIAIVWQNRGGDYTATGDSVQNNDVYFMGGGGIAGGVCDWDCQNRIYSQNTFAGNRYHFKNGVRGYFWWPNATSGGLDPASTNDTVAAPLTYRSVCDLSRGQ